MLLCVETWVTSPVTRLRPLFQNGMTCAHIAASKGSVAVIKELMRFSKVIVTTAKNKVSRHSNWKLDTPWIARQTDGQTDGQECQVNQMFNNFSKAFCGLKLSIISVFCPSDQRLVSPTPGRRGWTQGGCGCAAGGGGFPHGGGCCKYLSMLSIIASVVV